MIEEYQQNFSHPQEIAVKLVYPSIVSELKQAGINLHKISIDNNIITVTTDKEVSESTMLSIRQSVAYQDFTIKFLTSK